MNENHTAAKTLEVWTTHKQRDPFDSSPDYRRKMEEFTEEESVPPNLKWTVSI